MSNCAHNVCLQMGFGCSLEGQAGDSAAYRSQLVPELEAQLKLADALAKAVSDASARYNKNYRDAAIVETLAAYEKARGLK